MNVARVETASSTSVRTPPRPRRIAVVCSLAYSLINFRLDLLRAMVSAGHRVTAFAPEHDAQVAEVLAANSIAFRTVPMQRTGLSPFADLRTLGALVRAFREEGIDTVLSYTMKPVIYGGLAGRIARVPERHALMTGLGTIYSPARKRVRHRLLRALSSRLYAQGLGGTIRVFVYNGADEADIRSNGMLGAGTRLVRVPGSGVDLDRFAATPLPSAPVRFLMISRLLEEKGVREFAAAARTMREAGCRARVRLVGPLDSNPTAITLDEVRSWEAEGILEYCGTTRDVRPFLDEASVFVLPTAYREGVPRTLLEALAAGRAVITTDRAGCADTVEDGRNGLLVPARDAGALAKAMLRLARDPSCLPAMGKRSREIAEERFDVHRVNRLLLSEMGLI